MQFLFGKEKLIARPSWIEILRSLIGGTLSILVLIFLGKYVGHIWIMAPFGASCVLLYAASQSPFSQPRNLIFGHLVAATIGLVLLKIFGSNVWTIALAVGLSISLMQFLRCVHPPAGATPLVILLGGSYVQFDWSFLIFPVFFGAIILVAIAYLVNNFRATQKWPHYGLALFHSKK